ncbi:MAG: hypothetical protein RBS53_08515 [Bacteroidales bacterium]|jgi:hypothetical protein|nr:hypothetical protein [Bacteroidales bacterium]
MKTIRKNFLLLAFAAGALFLIGNNVFAGEDPNESEDPGDGSVIQLYYHKCSHYHNYQECRRKISHYPCDYSLNCP